MKPKGIQMFEPSAILTIADAAKELRCSKAHLAKVFERPSAGGTPPATPAARVPQAHPAQRALSMDGRGCQCRLKIPQFTPVENSPAEYWVPGVVRLWHAPAPGSKFFSDTGAMSTGERTSLG